MNIYGSLRNELGHVAKMPMPVYGKTLIFFTAAPGPVTC